jgi:hypothetical protein
MSNLTGETIKDTYGGVINIGPSGASASFQSLTDGLGNTLPLEISTNGVNFTGTVSGLTPLMKNLEVTIADIVLVGIDTEIQINFASPFPSANYSIFFNFSLDPNNIGSGNEYWFSEGGPTYLLFYTNKTANGFKIVIPNQDLTFYSNFLGYVNCATLGEN